jgi:hypothetical protein
MFIIVLIQKPLGGHDTQKREGKRRGAFVALLMSFLAFGGRVAGLSGQDVHARYFSACVQISLDGSRRLADNS